MGLAEDLVGSHVTHGFFWLVVSGFHSWVHDILFVVLSFRSLVSRIVTRLVKEVRSEVVAVGGGVGCSYVCQSAPSCQRCVGGCGCQAC